MAIDFTMTERIASLKRRALAPGVQNLYRDADFVTIMSEEMLDTIVPQILQVKEDYFVTPYTTPVVSGTQSYSIPPRAMGAKLKDLVIVDGSGNTINLPRLSYTDVVNPPFGDISRLYGFYFQDDNIVLYPNDKFVGQSLKLYIYRRPNNLVETSSAGKILSINTGTREVTLDNAPTTWTTALLYDVIKGNSPFYSVADDQVVTAIVGFTLTFQTLPTGIAVGDYVAESGESPIPQVPYEAFGLISQAGAVKVLEGLGDGPGLQAAQAKYELLKKDFFTNITPRADDEPKRLVSRKGIFRSGRMAWLRS